MQAPHSLGGLKHRTSASSGLIRRSSGGRCLERGNRAVQHSPAGQGRGREGSQCVAGAARAALMGAWAVQGVACTAQGTEHQHTLWPRTQQSSRGKDQQPLGRRAQQSSGGAPHRASRLICGGCTHTGRQGLHSFCAVWQHTAHARGGGHTRGRSTGRWPRVRLHSIQGALAHCCSRVSAGWAWRRAALVGAQPGKQRRTEREAKAVGGRIHDHTAVLAGRLREVVVARAACAKV